MSTQTRTHPNVRVLHPSFVSKCQLQSVESVICLSAFALCTTWGHLGVTLASFWVTLGSISTKRSVSTRKSDFLNSNQRSSHFWVMSVRSIYTGPVDDLKLALAPHVVNANWLRGKPKVESRTQKQIRLGGWGQWYHHSRHCSPICRSRRNAR